MSDTSLPVILRFDTAANRAAFVPDPGSPEQLYLWADSDSLPDIYFYDYAAPAWELINPTVAGGITQLTGDVTAGPGSGSQAATIANDAVTTAKILNANVTLAKIANIATDRLLGRDTAASGVIEELTAGAGLAFTGVPGIDLTTAQKTRNITVDINGGGSVIATGLKGYLRIPVACTIIDWTILAQDGLTGSIVIDIWLDTYANFPPTVADTITAAAKPTVTTNIKDTSSTLTGWTTAIPAGSVLGFNVDSVTTFQHVSLQLQLTVN